MKLLLDQDVYFATERFLRELGHDVVTAAELGCSRSRDADLLQRARELDRIFVTRDRGSGGAGLAGQSDLSRRRRATDSLLALRGWADVTSAEVDGSEGRKLLKLNAGRCRWHQRRADEARPLPVR